MSYMYTEYIKTHKLNVQKGFKWINDNLPHLIKKEFNLEIQILNHDNSKLETDEYRAYDEYFYGDNRSELVIEEFNKAWLLHIHRNPHHWQYWILINDEPDTGETIIEMGYNYIIEMICDWWAFSWDANNLNEIFSWYAARKTYIKLHPNTRKVLESILREMCRKLKDISSTPKYLFV